MSDSDNKETYYVTLGLSSDATLNQVKSRYRELNDAYLKILELSRSSAKTGKPGQPTKAVDKTVQHGPQQVTNPPRLGTRTEPITEIKARFAKGEIQKAEFEKLARERYNYLESKPFSELSDSEFEERLRGFEGLKFL